MKPRMTKVQGTRSKEGPNSKDQLTPGDSEPWHNDRDDEEYPEVQSGAYQLREGDEYRPPAPRNYDLLDRTAKFGEAIIRFAKKIPQNPVNNRLIDQLVGCGTSVGASYWEADDAVSMKDFRNRIGTCRKEAKEFKFFIRMVATAVESLKPEARLLWQEAKELHLIFCKILHNTAAK